MDYLVVSTSKCKYQEWQIKLLNWTRKKVGQSGKLIILLSEDIKHKGEVTDFNFVDKEVFVYNLPDWAKEWELQENDWWGGIPNKYKAVEWVCRSNLFNDDDKLLFLDPDMIFIKPVDFILKDNHIVGQKFIHFTPIPDLENKITSSYPVEGIMYPFALKFKTLKEFSDKYTQYCQEIRKKTGKWEAEMYGLDYAIKHSGIKLDFIEDLGTCTAWNDTGRSTLGKIIHYPNVIPDKNYKKIFFKQDHTFDLEKKYDLTNIISQAGNKVVTNVDQSRTDYLYFLKWDFSDIFKFYTGNNGYIVFRPWPGGFNNIRMSLELAVGLSFLTNRKLVLPPEYNMYLLEGSSKLEAFFNTVDLGVIAIPFLSFCEDKNIEPTFESIKKISKVLDFDLPRHVLNFEKNYPPSKFHKNRPILKSEDLFNDEECLFFDSNLLGISYQTFFTSYDIQLKKLIGKHVRYRTEIFDLAWQFINKLGDRNYYSIHIRRNDFQYKELFISCEEILENIKDIVPKGSKLYIATDHKDRKYFDILSTEYSLYFYSDVLNDLNLYEEIDNNWVPIIEQLICTRSIKFIGNSHSTLSSYIFRMRGYMTDIEDKNYYINTEKFDISKQVSFSVDNKFKGNWFREYSNSWSFGNGSIFVSIASYCDTQLIDTLKSLYSEAIDTKRIYVGVNLQDTEEMYNTLKTYNFPNLKIIFTPKEQSKGVVHARNRIKRELLDKEDYYLQIDSHSRFRQGWDAILISQYNSIEEDKVIITTYPNHFDVPDYEKNYLTKPNFTPLKIKRFLQNSNLDDNRCVAGNLPTLEDYSIANTRWVAAGFLFTRTQWTKEVILPDNIRFNGEEDFQTFISYLQGWNLKVPSLATVWHNYDHNVAETKKPYRERNGKYFIEDNSVNLLNDELFKGNYTRTIEELEEYFDINLRRKYV